MKVEFLKNKSKNKNKKHHKIIKEISSKNSQNDIKKLEDMIKNQIKHFGREDEDKNKFYFFI